MSLSDEEKKLIGGSDVSALVGLNPYKTAIDVFARIVDGREDPETKAMRRGTLLEPVIRAMAAEEFGLQFLGPRKVRPKEFLRASLDDVIKADDGEEVAEFKSVGPFAAGEYGEEETDQVPTQHLLQCQMYMSATGLPRARLIALVGTDDLRQYVITADAEIQSMLVESAERFWKDHVLKRSPPPLDGSDSTARWLQQKFPKNKGDIVRASPEVDAVVREYFDAKRALTAAEEREGVLKHQLQATIGEADALLGEGWQITWKRTKDSRGTDWEGVARELGVTPELLKKHAIITKTGTRRFLAKELTK